MCELGSDRGTSLICVWGGEGGMISEPVTLLHQGGPLSWLASCAACFPHLKSPPHHRAQEIAWGCEGSNAAPHSK